MVARVRHRLCLRRSAPHPAQARHPDARFDVLAFRPDSFDELADQRPVTFPQVEAALDRGRSRMDRVSDVAARPRIDDEPGRAGTKRLASGYMRESFSTSPSLERSNAYGAAPSSLVNSPSGRTQQLLAAAQKWSSGWPVTRRGSDQ
jgi:hypothetical protein